MVKTQGTHCSGVLRPTVAVAGYCTASEMTAATGLGQRQGEGGSAHGAEVGDGHASGRKVLLLRKLVLDHERGRQRTSEVTAQKSATGTPADAKCSFCANLSWMTRSVTALGCTCRHLSRGLCTSMQKSAQLPPARPHIPMTAQHRLKRGAPQCQARPARPRQHQHPRIPVTQVEKLRTSMPVLACTASTASTSMCSISTVSTSTRPRGTS